MFRISIFQGLLYLWLFRWISFELSIGKKSLLAEPGTWVGFLDKTFIVAGSFHTAALVNVMKNIEGDGNTSIIGI